MNRQKKYLIIHVERKNIRMKNQIRINNVQLYKKIQVKISLYFTFRLAVISVIRDNILTNNLPLFSN